MNVEFPGLGLSFEMRTWAFKVFEIPIYWYGIIIALAFLTAIVLGIKSCRKYSVEPDTILDLVLYAAPAAIVGARLYYVLLNWNYFKGDLIAIFNIRSGGLAIYGGVIAAILVAWIYCRVKKINFLHLIDFCVPYLMLGQAIGRWGNFVNQEAFGYETNLPWRMNGDIVNADILSRVGNIDLTKWGAHPTFLYESIWDIGVFLFLIYYRKKKKVNGEVLCLYFILYGIGRFFIENLRTDSLMLGELRASRILSLVLVFVFAGVFVYLKSKKKNVEKEVAEDIGRSEYSDLLESIKAEEEEAKVASEEISEEDKQDIEDRQGFRDKQDHEEEQVLEEEQDLEEDSGELQEEEEK